MTTTVELFPPEEADALLAAALSYARRGWPVLPLHSIYSRGCTCGRADCPSPGKHPVGLLVPHGVEYATTDADALSAWWHHVPFANIGVATGHGLAVLDVDPSRGGRGSLAALEREHGTLPRTPTVASGGDGLHIYFGCPDALGTRKDFAPGVELKATAAYVVAPPSRHRSGRAYRWLISPDEVALAPLPEWLRQVGSAAGVTERKPGAGITAVAGSVPNDFYALLLTDPELWRRWSRPLDHFPSLSEAALSIASRVARRTDYSDGELLAILAEFYRAHGRSAALTKLRLTVAKAKAGASVARTITTNEGASATSVAEESRQGR